MGNVSAVERTEEGLREAELQLLNRAFLDFNRATSELQSAYLALQERVKELKAELEEKNLILERNLREKEAVETELSNILNSLSTGVTAFDESGNLTIFNRAAREITGYTPEEISRKGYRGVLDMFLKLSDQRPEALSLKGGIKEVETTLIRKDGISIQLRSSLTPVIGSGGAPAGVIILIQDVTRLRKLEEQAERNQRLAAMGEMATRISHEVRNPLGSIELFASYLKRMLPQGDESWKIAEHIEKGVKSLDHVLSNLLHFTSLPKPVLAELDLASVLEDSCAFAEPLFEKSGVGLRRFFYAEDAAMLGDPELLKQVFYNLILNALQAMPNGGTLTVVTNSKISNGLAERSLEPASGRSGSRKGNGPTGGGNGGGYRPERSLDGYVEVKFIDNGHGMTREVMEKIFDPFFSTKAKGTGLGLSIVNNIVRSHNGMIEVDSLPGRGTVFTLTFPLLIGERVADPLSPDGERSWT